MRYVAALCYALAIAAHSGALLNTLMLGGLVFLGVVATLFAFEGIINDALRSARRQGFESHSDGVSWRVDGGPWHYRPGWEPERKDRG